MSGRDPRGTVAVILATTVGVGVVASLLMVLGPWTPQPPENVAIELFALISAGLGALSVWLGMGRDLHRNDNDNDREDDHASD